MKLKITKGGKQIDLNELFSTVEGFAPAEDDDCPELPSGMSSTCDCPHSLFSDSDHLKAMDKLHQLVCVRERTEKESYERLVKHGFDPETSRAAVDRAVECGLISNERYAQAYIRGKLKSGWGKRRIIEQLRAAGLSDEIIESCDYLFPSYEKELERALEELVKRPARSKNPRMTYMRRLLQKGYSQDVAYRAVGDYVARHIS